MTRFPLARFLTGLASSLAITPLMLITAPAEASSADSMITKLCLAGFSAAMGGAGKTAPAGMADYTCSCFLNQVNQQASLNEAQSLCTKLATARYGLKAP